MKKLGGWIWIVVLAIALLGILIGRFTVNKNTGAADTRMAVLYAVKPDNTYILADVNGNLWEVDDNVDIEEDDVLLLEIKDNHVVKIWEEVTILDSGDGKSTE